MSGENGNGQQIVRKPDRTPLSQRDPVSLAQHFAASRFFKDTTDVSKAVVKIVAGEELGIGPMAAVQGITIIEGELGMTANLMATLVQRHDDYRYEVVETTNERCKLEFYEIRENGEDELLGESLFEIADAKRAGLVKPRSNWEKWPKAMCFARALSQGVRTYCPIVTSGTPAYVAEELGAEVDEQGEVVSVPNLDADAPVEEAVDAVIELLDESLVEGLVQGIEFLEWDRNAVNMALGSLGKAALDEAFPDLRDALARLSQDEAGVLLADLQREAEKLASKGGDDAHA